MPLFARTFNEGLSAIGSRGLLGALSGGTANYLEGGSLDHGLKGALVGAGLGAASGGLLGGNKFLSATSSLALPALLAQQKSRPITRELYTPRPYDPISALYTEENMFEENSPEWQEYYAANPDRYKARYGTGGVKLSAFSPDAIGGTGSAVDLDYYRLQKELREKGYSRREREKMLRNDFPTQLSDFALAGGLGMGLGGLGLYLGNVAADHIDNDFVSHMAPMVGGMSGLMGGSMLAAQRIYDKDQDAIEAAELAPMKKKASMSLKDLAYMESISGVNVGRVKTSAGTIVDSNGVYTLYDSSGENIYGKFSKLSEAQAYAEKVAQYQIGQAADGTYQVMRGGQAVAADANYQGRGLTTNMRMKDHMKYQQQLMDQRAKVQQLNSLRDGQQIQRLRNMSAPGLGNIPGTNASNAATQALSVQNMANHQPTQATQRFMGASPAPAPAPQAQVPAQTPRAPAPTPAPAPQAQAPRAPVGRTYTQQQVNQQTRMAAEKARQRAAKQTAQTLAKQEASAAANLAKAKGWATVGKAGLGGLAAAGLGYLGYKAFAPEEKSFVQRFGDQVSNYAPMIQQATNVMGAFANPGGAYQAMGYQAPGAGYGQYRNM